MLTSCRACWVVRHLALTYPTAYNIISFDKLDYCSSLNNTGWLEGRPNYAFVRGGVTNPAEVVDCMERHHVDTVLHFAAQSHVDLSFGNSYGFTHTNVYGTHVLLECAKKARVRRFIHISTDEVYGEVREHDGDLLESSILAPTNPYAASKAAAEMLVQSYQKSFKLPVIIVRSNNVYGPHQYPESKRVPLGERSQGSRPCQVERQSADTEQKSYPSLHASCTEASPSYFTAMAARHGGTYTQLTRPTRSTRFCTRANWARFTTWDPTMRSPI